MCIGKPGMLRVVKSHPGRAESALQALQTDWIVTKGGKVPRPLNPDVARGAANVAAARRLRNMVHGAVAIDPDSGSADGSQRGPQEHLQEYKKRHTAQGQAAQQSRGYRQASLSSPCSCCALLGVQLACCCLCFCRLCTPAFTDISRFMSSLLRAWVFVLAA